VYNEEDAEVCKSGGKVLKIISEKIPYKTPEYEISNGKVFLKNRNGRHSAFCFWGS